MQFMFNIRNYLINKLTVKHISMPVTFFFPKKTTKIAEESK